MTNITEADQGKRELRRFREEVEWHRVTLKELEKFPSDETKLFVPFLKAQLEYHEKVIRCVEEGEPLLASYWSICPEVYRAMDIQYFCIMGHHYQQSQASSVITDLEESEKLGLARDNCSLLRLALYYIKAGLMPKPTMIIHKLEPCDAVVGLNETIMLHKEWGDIPCYSLDPPYWDDERTLDYYADETKGVVTFLEEQTGKRLDIDRLREVVEESNRQYLLWMEYAELKRAVPCPHSWEMGAQLYPLVQLFWAGDPRCTDWLRVLVADAEEKVSLKKGGVEPEKIRVLWFDVFGFWLKDLAAWLAQEWSANIVMDMSVFCPYTLIDTSTEDTIFKGFAKRSLCDQVMIRQVRGTADRLLTDLRRMVHDYKIDAVIPPTHVGHKDQVASLGLMREVCRDLGVAFLDMGTVDIYDPKYTTMEEIQEKLSRQFTVLGLG